jgi:hypothetical protein
LRNTLASRPVTSLSNSNRPTRSLEGFVGKRPCSSRQAGDVKQRRSRRNSGVGAGSVVSEIPWGRSRRDLSVVSCMGLGEMTRDGGMEQHKYHFFPSGIPRLYYTTPKTDTILISFQIPAHVVINFSTLLHGS